MPLFFNTKPTIPAVLSRPVSETQIRRAQALCSASPALLCSLEVFLGSNPDFTQLDDYIKELKSGFASAVVAALAGTLRQLTTFVSDR
jgi:hypothetical protein